MADEIVTKGAFARLVNVTPGRVSQYIAAGQLHGDALVGAGHRARIRVEVAKAQLRQSLDITQLAGNGLDTRLSTGPSRSRPLQPADRKAAEQDPIEEQIKRERLEALQFENRRRAEEEELRAGRYVLADDMRREIGATLIRMMQDFESTLIHFSNAIAAKFNLSQRDIVHLLRTEFRGFRAKRAAQIQEAVDGMPVLKSDEGEEQAIGTVQLGARPADRTETSEHGSSDKIVDPAEDSAVVIQTVSVT